jgi:predicted ribosome quality control (RQC) complex YloA/Tae2 family protein
MLAARARWKTRLDGARIVGISKHAIVLIREDVLTRVLLKGAELGFEDCESIQDTDFARADEVDDWLALGAKIADDHAESALAEVRIALARAIGKAIEKINRRAAAVREDLESIERAHLASERAALFVAAAARASRGSRSLEITDWSTGEAQTQVLDLDPSRSAREQIDAIFRRAKRLRRGEPIAQSRLEEAARIADSLRELRARVAIATFEETTELRRSAKVAAPRDFRAPTATVSSTKERATPSLPYRTFLGARSARILVGRGAAHNDALTLHIAKPHDLWLHAKGEKGAHVIVPLDRNASCPADILIEAAHLAAHFSDVRAESTVDIEYTLRRHLRKPRGSAPGLVLVSREKVIALRADEVIVRRLLANEVL